MSGGTVGGGGRLNESEVAGERLVHWHGIGLRVHDDPLVVWDRPAHIRVPAFDRGERGRVCRQGVGYSLALDQSHVPAAGGDE